MHLILNIAKNSVIYWKDKNFEDESQYISLLGTKDPLTPRQRAIMNADAEGGV